MQQFELPGPAISAGVNLDNPDIPAATQGDRFCKPMGHNRLNNKFKNIFILFLLGYNPLPFVNPSY